MSSDEPGSESWASPNPQPPPTGYGYPPPSGYPPPAGYPPAGPPPAYGAYGNPSPYGWVQAQAPKPGVVPLRPLGVGEMLDGAFTTIRRYPSATIGLGAAVMLVVSTVQVFANYYLVHGVERFHTTAYGTTTNGDFLARQYTADGIVRIVGLPLLALLTGMLAMVIGQAVLGRPMTISGAWAKTRPIVGRLLGATALQFLAWLVALVPGFVLVLVGSASGIGALTGFGVLLVIIGVPAAIFVWVKLAMVTPAIALEGLSITDGFRRSWRLVSTTWWRVFGIQLLALVIAGIIGAVLVIPFGLLGGGFSGLFSTTNNSAYNFVPQLFLGIGSLLAGMLTQPFQAGVISLLYIDRRMRAEALDLTLQKTAATPQQPTVATPTS